MMGSEMLLGLVRRQCYAMVLLVLVASVLWSPVSLAESTMGEQCPQECSCEADSTIRCSGVAGLRGMDKSQPIARLVLSGLELTKIPASLENMRNITELDLSENRLSEVNHLGKRVRKLNLSHNRITSGKLARIPPFVESLNLTHNEITHLPLHLMKLKKLRYIELANNPINCTCETLHIRNWLTSRHVWSDEHIKCMAPAEFKGRPWLQVRQSDVCHPSVVEERKGGYNWDDYEDDNELMLGDQPHHVAANEDNEQEDDLHSDFLPVNREKVKRQEPLIVEDNNDELDEASGHGPALGESSIGAEARGRVFDNLVAADDGSGDDSPSLQAHTEKNAVEDEDSTDDGSGSGGGLLVGFKHISADETGSFDITSETIPVDDGMEDVKKDEEEESPLGYPTVNGNLGIFVDETSPPTSATTEEETTSERQNERVMLGGAIGGVKMADSEGGAPVIGGESDRTAATQSEEDNRNTYILLAILGIIVVSLIVMVVCKRKPDSRNRRGKYDVETANQGRELKEMNKNLLEKPPGDRNGHGVAGGGAPEQAPLMGKSDYDKVFGDPQKTAFTPVKPQRTSLEKPMESFKPIPAERNGVRGPESDNNNTATLPNGNGALHNGGEQVHKTPVPVVPDTTDPDGHLLAEPPMESPRSKRYSPIYVPTSPKSDRYSPVYSPETGRVKIKLTETPKPKTPILVTRSRSRAGEIITTMDDQKF
ncbi:AGAP006644-PA-like protein [Anopheles sinensis]|uniref:AGAP006644-PA-like protein n=1 Tax=Anopheles sinensis TaxID=74873 RepID=A0A084WMD9_ANOSI|nr:AGAP006644-PA-like protein [Anopheles sinensis]